jgi:hypothetical protein
MKPAILAALRPAVGAHGTAYAARAPLRRSLPPGRTRKPLPNALLAFGAAVVFFDIEVGLAYLLYFAARLLG